MQSEQAIERPRRSLLLFFAEAEERQKEKFQRTDRDVVSSSRDVSYTMAHADMPGHEMGMHRCIRDLRHAGIFKYCSMDIFMDKI